MALAAAAVWGEGGIADAALADVAVVAGGLYPSYTGGPFTYLRQAGEDPVSTCGRRRGRASGFGLRAAGLADLSPSPAAVTESTRHRPDERHKAGRAAGRPRSIRTTPRSAKMHRRSRTGRQAGLHSIHDDIEIAPQMHSIT